MMGIKCGLERGIVGRGVVEDGIHLILKHRDIARFRDVERTGAFWRQGFSTEVKGLIWGAGRHVEKGQVRDSSTTRRQR